MGQIKGQTATNNTITKDVTVTEDVGASKVALDVNVASGSLQAGGSIISEEFDSFQVTARTPDGCPTTVVYSLGGSTVATVTITYDLDGNLDTVVKS